MVSSEELLLRDRRDYLIELIGLGKTFPLQNLPLQLASEPYLVTFNNPARIGIGHTQGTVLYQLHEDGKLVERNSSELAKHGTPVERPGNESSIQLVSNNIHDDKRFQISATKFDHIFFLPFAFAKELDQARISDDLRNAFERLGRIILPDDAVVTRELYPGSTGLPDIEIGNPSIGETQTLSWLVYGNNTQRTSDRFLIRNMGQILVVYKNSNRSTYLRNVAEVRVGLDKSLHAWIADAPFLAVESTPQADTAARIIDFGATVTVEIEGSQEGVYYRLVTGVLDSDGTYADRSPPQKDNVLLAPDEIEGKSLGKLGTGENITLTSVPIEEDVDIRIRAIKTFPEAGQRDNETALLSVILPLRVRANPNMTVSVEPGPIVEYGSKPTIRLTRTQSSAKYSLYGHRIRDREFCYGTIVDNVLAVGVSGEADVQVRYPPRPHPWQDSSEFSRLGESLAGIDSSTRLALDETHDDSVIIIKAEKVHRLTTFDQPATRIIRSAVQLNDAVLVLVRPNVSQEIHLKVMMGQNLVENELTVDNGEPGIYYTFIDAEDHEPIVFTRPVYFHQLDDTDPEQNKGLNQLRIEVDFTIIQDHPEGQPADPTRTPPPVPMLRFDSTVIGDALLNVRAMKSHTRVKAIMDRTITILPLPPMEPEDEIVPFNGSTRLLIRNSVEGDRYQPFVNGKAVKQARFGNGGELVFRTDQLVRDTAHEIRVTRPKSGELALTRSVLLSVAVGPNPNLAVTLTESIIEFADVVNIQIENSQPGISYQLMTDTSSIGNPAVGTGDILYMTTEPLEEDSVIFVEATRPEPLYSVPMEAKFEIVVRPNRNLTVSSAPAFVTPGKSSIVKVHNTQETVRYSLLKDDGNALTQIGESLKGDGSTIELPTGPLIESSSFIIRAAKRDNPDISVEMVQTATVDVFSG